MADSSHIDPQWAWQPFEPTADEPWNRRRVAHLYRRAGFGISWAQMDGVLSQSPSSAVADLVKRSSESPEEFEDLAQTILAGGNARQLSAWWLYVMLHGRAQLREKLTLFWHGHFATSADKVDNANLMYEQNRLLRQNSLGRFPPLVHAISRDPAMLVYLDSATNRKAHPNENYARELMELFCLGEGNYSEQDIQQLARCFTGWEIRRGRFRFNRYQHDTGEKSILGQTGKFPEGEAIDLVLQQPSAAAFLAGKLIRYYVADDDIVSPELVEPIANDLQNDDWDIARVVQRILSSQLFFSAHALGRKIRSPVEMTVGLLKSLDGTTDTVQLAEDLHRLGQGLFYPPNVKGWDGGRAWINTTRLLERANAVGRLIRDSKTRFRGQQLAEYFAAQDVSSPAELVDHLTELLLAVPLPANVRSQIVAMNDAQGMSNDNVTRILHALCILPEFQLC